MQSNVPSTPSAQPVCLAAAATASLADRSAPIELDAAWLKHVSGGTSSTKAVATALVMTTMSPHNNW